MEAPLTTGSFRARPCGFIVALYGLVFPLTRQRGRVLQRVGARHVATCRRIRRRVRVRRWGGVRCDAWPIAARDLPRDARALTFLDRHGTPLGTILGRDDRHTVAVPLGRIAPSFWLLYTCRN